MSRRSVRVLVADMLEAMERIDRYTTNLDLSAFLADEKTSDADVRNLEIVGEAAAHVPAEYWATVPDVESAKLVGLRNRIVHGYFAVDLVWRIVTTDLPPLASRLRALLASPG
jgi:uncharacterized protein with HEPN domain